jgi:hypothetical protein
MKFNGTNIPAKHRIRMGSIKLFRDAFPVILTVVFSIFTIVTPAHADEDFFSNWFARVTKIQSEQPSWMTPVFTTTPRLDEEIHYDQSIQTAKGGVRVDNYGNSKGLELIPFQNVQVNLGVPPWIARDKPSNKGWLWR